MHELVNFRCFSRFDSCISFGADLWRFLRVLPALDRQCKLDLQEGTCDETSCGGYGDSLLGRP